MKHQFYYLLFFLFCYTNISAQKFNPNICKDGDCSESIFTIQLNEPIQPVTPNDYTQERTDQFIKAFNSFQEIKNTYTLKKGWADKRKESQLSGQSCARHYQLEAQLSYEYIYNADFKKYIDSKNSNSKSFITKGFEGSRKGINLTKRMSTRCPEKIDELKQKPGPSLDELPKTYQKLGQELGYFDENGKLMRPLDPASTEGQDISKLSKKKQVKALKEQLAQMPYTNVVNDKITGVKNALDTAKPNLDKLSAAIGSIGSGLGSLLPDVSGIMGNAASVTNKLGDLKGMLPSGSAPDLLSGIGSLFNFGKGLGDKASGLLDKANNLKSTFDNLSTKSNDLQKEHNDKKSALDKLLNDLNDVTKKKAELEAKLEDKPKKILDALRQEIPDAVKKANDIVDKAIEATKEKDKLTKKLESLLQEKDKVNDKLKELETQKKNISDEFDKLEKDKNVAEEEVEKVKKELEKIDELKEKIENLKPKKKLQDAISYCESGLTSMLSSLIGLNEKKESIKSKIGGLLSLPDALTSKLSDLKAVQEKLKLPEHDIPVPANILAKVDGLLAKTTAASSTIEALTGKKIALNDKVKGLDQLLDSINVLSKLKIGNVSNLKEELITLLAEKTTIKEKLNEKVDDLNDLSSTVTSFVDRFNLFGKKTDCKEGKELKNEVEKLEKELTETEPEIEDFEKEIEEVETKQNELTEETKEIENEKSRQLEKIAELKQKEQLIKQEYGTDIKLDPVSVEEWSESFEVKRPYWEAVFHPDDEVVEGQKGRYFEVKLKDADKNVKLLFGPGKYCMSKSDFRNKYGSTIGSFVTEALHAMKKSNQDKVKIFIQGSADNVGHETFSGKLDQQFFYEAISVLPQKADPEKFSNAPEAKAVPQKNFRNIHLPDLRAQYLKEMIKVYSKKFDPVVLEGVVKDFKDEEERNAIIYLYIPEELIVK